MAAEASPLLLEFDETPAVAGAEDHAHLADSMNENVHIGVRSGVRIRDHFTLDESSSTVRFRNRDVKVIGRGSAQLQIEDAGDGSAPLLRRAQDDSPCDSVRRGIHTLGAFLAVGMVFIFTVEILILTFLSVALSFRKAQDGIQIWISFGCVLSLFVWVNAFGYAMVIGTVFVQDAWAGNPFALTFVPIGRIKSVHLQWIMCLIYVGVPVVCAIYGFFGNADTDVRVFISKWWIRGVLILYFFYLIMTIYYEVRSFFVLIQKKEKLDGESQENLRCLTKFKNAVLAGTTMRYSGVRTRYYMVHTDLTNVLDETTSLSLYSRLAASHFAVSRGLFQKPTEPRRLFGRNEVWKAPLFVTSKTWNLATEYFSYSEDDHFLVVQGPEALTNDQKKSSILYALTSLVLSILLFAAILNLLKPSPPNIGIAVIIIGIYNLPKIRILVVSHRLYKAGLNKMRALESQSTCSTFRQVSESYQISYPRSCTCWIMVTLEIVAFFFLPLLSLLSLKDWTLAMFFFLMGVLVGLRFYFSPVNIVKQLGPLDKFLHEENNRNSIWEWKNQNRFKTILEKISLGHISKFWLAAFGWFGLFFATVFISTFMQPTTTYSEVTPFAELGYLPHGGISYATCRMDSVMTPPGLEKTGLIDYVFLSELAYYEPNVTKDLLDEWFSPEGGKLAFDQDEIVKEFKDTLSDEKKSAVSYKLIKFNATSEDDHYIIAIQGSVSGLDILTDGQIWGPAWIAQQVRWLVPYGPLFNVIYQNTIQFLGSVEERTLETVSYFREITEFVRWLQQNKRAKNIYLTGHSLGGGLAMISGAQTSRPAIALSGPNAMMTSLEIKDLETEQLNDYTFNIIPKYDPIPRIDDMSFNFQKIDCTVTGLKAPVACHSSQRSLCEVLYKCGSQGRRVPTYCYEAYDYPEPKYSLETENDNSLKVPTDVIVNTV